jgi:putative membrane protein
MFRFYDGYHLWGMHIIWWIIWILFIIWIFATPWGYRQTRDTSYNILRKRFASGEITKEEYQEAKKVLEEDFRKIVNENKG